MKRATFLTVLLLAALAAGGCLKRPMIHTLTVEATLDAAGRLSINEEFHQDAKLRPGDRLRWTCRCPDGARFAVQNIRHLAIGHLDEAEQELLVAAVQRGEAPEGGSYEPGDPFLGPTPAGASRAGEEILSDPYRVFDDEHLWKFDWVVTMEGQPVQIWDPHFSGHKRRR